MAFLVVRNQEGSHPPSPATNHRCLLFCAVLIPTAILVLLITLGIYLFRHHHRRPRHPVYTPDGALPPSDSPVVLICLDDIAETAGVKMKEGKKALTDREVKRLEKEVRRCQEKRLKELSEGEGRVFRVACEERREWWRKMDEEEEGKEKERIRQDVGDKVGIAAAAGP